MTDYIHAMFDNGTENIIRIFITNTFGIINYSPFISRCRRMLEFKAPTCDTITTLISGALNITLEAARTLANLIEVKEKQREAAYNIDAQIQLTEDEQLEKVRKPVIVI